MRSKLIPPGLAFLSDNIISRQNILGASRKEGAQWARGLNLPGKGDTVFFAGCGYQYAPALESLTSLVRRLDRSVIGAELPMRFANFQKKLGADLPGIYRKVWNGRHAGGAPPLEAAVKVLSGMGVGCAYLAEQEPCCGAPLYYAGLHREFASNAQHAYRELQAAGVKRIIGLVPSCTYALKELFGRYVPDYNLEVSHFCEVVAARLSPGKLRFPRDVAVTYHDPCQLVRYLGLVEEPRRILSSIEGIRLVESEGTSRECATCCGGGGGFEAVFPELSEVLAENRVQELLATGAEIIVTHCPGCILQLQSGLKRRKITGVEVMDLTQVAAMAMEG